MNRWLKTLHPATIPFIVIGILISFVLLIVASLGLASVLVDTETTLSAKLSSISVGTIAFMFCCIVPGFAFTLAAMDIHETYKELHK